MPAGAQLAKPQREVIPARSQSLRGAKITGLTGRFRTQAVTIKERRTYFALASRRKLYRELLLLSPSRRRPLSLSLSLYLPSTLELLRAARCGILFLSFSLAAVSRLQRPTPGCGVEAQRTSGGTREYGTALASRSGHARATGANPKLSMAAASLLSARRLPSPSSP